MNDNKKKNDNSNESKYEKLSRTDDNDTIMYAGQAKLTIKQLEHEVKMDSDIGKKLKSIERILDENY